MDYWFIVKEMPKVSNLRVEWSNLQKSVKIKQWLLLYVLNTGIQLLLKLSKSSGLFKRVWSWWEHNIP